MMISVSHLSPFPVFARSCTPYKRPNCCVVLRGQAERRCADSWDLRHSGVGGASGGSLRLTHDLLKVSGSDPLIILFALQHGAHTSVLAFNQRSCLQVCAPVCFHGCLVCHLMVNKTFSRFWLSGWKTRRMLYLADGSLSHSQARAGSLYANVLACTSLGTHLHIHIVVCRCVWTGMSVQFVPEGAKRPTPAGDLQRASLSSGEARTERERGDETENRGVSLSTPRHCYFKLFSSYWGRREQYTAHTLAWSTPREQHSQLFQRAEERKKKIKEERGEGKEGRGERYRQQER